MTHAEILMPLPNKVASRKPQWSDQMLPVSQDITSFILAQKAFTEHHGPLTTYQRLTVSAHPQPVTSTETGEMKESKALVHVSCSKSASRVLLLARNIRRLRSSFYGLIHP